jgi:hypothetical protein
VCVRLSAAPEIGVCTPERRHPIPGFHFPC